MLAQSVFLGLRQFHLLPGLQNLQSIFAGLTLCLLHDVES